MLATLLFSAVLFGTGPTEAGKYFTIQVVDGETGRGVPLVELRTVHGVRRVTDSNGLVAFHDIVPGPSAEVGGVPSFWQQIRDPEAIEIVEDRQQRSFGIGVLRL